MFVLIAQYPVKPAQVKSSQGYQNAAFLLSSTNIINSLNKFFAFRALLAYAGNSILNFISIAFDHIRFLLNLLNNCKLSHILCMTTSHLSIYYTQLSRIPSHDPCKSEETSQEWKDVKHKGHWTNGCYTEGNENESDLQLRVGGRYSVPSLKLRVTVMYSKHFHKASYVRLTTL